MPVTQEFLEEAKKKGATQRELELFLARPHKVEKKKVQFVKVEDFLKGVKKDV